MKGSECHGRRTPRRGNGTMTSGSELIDRRMEKLRLIRAGGYDPYPANYDLTHEIPRILDDFSPPGGAGAGVRSAQGSNRGPHRFDPRPRQGQLRPPEPGEEAGSRSTCAGTGWDPRSTTCSGCWTSGTFSAWKASCCGPVRENSRSSPIRCSCCPSRCGPSPRSGTAWPTSRCDTVNAIWT